MHVLFGPISSKHSAQISFDRTLPEIEPFGRRDLGFSITPAIEIAEKEKVFEVTADLPSLDAKTIDLQLSDGVLTVKGEKQEDKEEKTKDRYVSERRYGSSRRSLQIPGSVDAEKIEANFKGGVLTVEVARSGEEAEADPGKREVNEI